MPEMRPRLVRIKDYGKFLDERWAEHSAPRAADAPTVGSLFAGCGGSSLGYSMAGFRELFAVEWDRDAAATLKMNFPETILHSGDIAKFMPLESLEGAGLKVGELDVLDGSPPCQGFSIVGLQKSGDPRSQLYLEFVRILKSLMPRVFVVENVTGLIQPKMKPVFVNMLRDLRSAGYRVRVFVGDASYYGAPQARKRVIFVGVREDMGTQPSFPTAWSIPTKTRDALIGVRPGQPAPEPCGKAAVCAQRVRPGSDASEIYQKEIGRPMLWGLTRAALDKSCPVIVKTFRPAQAGMLHPYENRHFSIPELKRLSSFPDQFEMVGDYKACHAQLGNCVVPVFMRSIATHIRESILER